MSVSIPESQQQYGSLLTILGENAEQNGKLLNKQITFTHIDIGDANDDYVQPNRNQQALVNPLARIPVNSVDIMQADENAIPLLKVEAVLPDDLNDLVIREFAAVAEFNGQEYLHAVGNCARIYVPAPLNNGNVSTPVIIEMIFAITSAEAIVEIDPNVVQASREWVKNAVINDVILFNGERGVKEKLNDIVNVQDFGAKGSNDINDTTAFENANGIGSVYVGNKDFKVDWGAKAEDSLFVGKGELNSLNTPNTLSSGLSLTKGNFFNGVIPERHLRKAAEKAFESKPVKVVLMGDSLSGIGSKNIMTDNLWSVIQGAFRAKNPTVDFEFVNRAIGAMTVIQAATGNQFGTPHYWYTEDKPWFDYIEDEQPDVLVISFGMNDRNQFSVNHAESLLNKARLLESNPDIILCTNIVPSRMSDIEEVSSFVANDGRDMPAQWFRSIAELYDFGIIDINKHWHTVMDGVDYENTYTKKVIEQEYQTTPISYVQDVTSNFTWELEIDSIAETMFGNLRNQFEARLRLDTSRPDQPNSRSWIDIGHVDGKLAIEVGDNKSVGFHENRFGAGDGGWGQQRFITDVQIINGSSIKLTLGVKGSKMVLFVDDIPTLHATIRRCGGTFNPTLAYELGEAEHTFKTSLSIGIWNKVCHPIMTDKDMYGTGGAGAEEGNGLNHPTTKGLSVIYTPVVDYANLSIPSVSLGERQAGIKTVSVGKKKSLCRWHTGRNGSGNEFNITGKGAYDRGLELYNSIGGDTIFVEDVGLYNFSVTTPSTSDYFHQSYNTSNALYQFNIKGNPVITYGNPLDQPDLSTGVFLWVNRGGTLEQRMVTLGAEDSGGIGHRVLRVVN